MPLSFATAAGDPDGNFQRTRIWANYENQGWSEIRNTAAGSDGFAYALSRIGGWQFHCRSLDNEGVESATAIVNVTSTNRAPINLSLNSLPATMLLGDSVAVTSGAHDADGNLSGHMFWRRGPRGSDTFSEDWDGWQNYDDNSAHWSNWSHPGQSSNPTNSTISAIFTPPDPGYWQFHANAWDAHNAWSGGVTGDSVFVAPQPSATITVSKGQTSVGGGGNILVNVGQTVTITSSANAAGWLSEHNVYGYVNGDPNDWFSLPSGGAWLPGAEYSTQSNRGVTWQPTSPGTYTLYVEAFTGRSGGERVGGTSGYPGYLDGSANKRVTVTVVGHESPNVNFTISAATVYIGQTLSLHSQATDVNSDMVLHTFWWDQGDGSRWTSPQFQYHEFEPNGEGWNDISNQDGEVSNNGNSTITANWTPVRPGIYQFHSNAQDARAGWGNGSEYTITVPNRTPSVSYSILDTNRNALAPDGNGRVTIPVHGNYYVRVQGFDPDGRLSKLYLRMSNSAGASQNWAEVAASGANASHDFGPYNPGGTSGVWDVWAHAQDVDAVVWGGAPDFDGNNHGWATVGNPDVHAYSGSVPTATVAIDGYSANDTVPWYDGHPAPTVTVRYRAADADGNLQGIRPQAKTEWREWVSDDYGGHEETFSYFDHNDGQFVPQSGTNGEVVRTVILDKGTYWYFWTNAIDALGQLASSGDWHAGFLLEVESRPNPAPSGITINALPASIRLGESLNLASSSTDISGNMTNHMFWRSGPHSTGAFTDESWLSYSDAPEYWSSWTAPGHASGPSQSNITATYTPPAAGYWQFQANAWDGMGAWGTGASSAVVFVAPPPTATLQAKIGSRVAANGQVLRINSSQSVLISSTATSQGWLSLHNILGLQGNAPFVPAGGTANLSAAAGLTESKRSITWTPPSVGTYVFYVEASTGNSSGSRVNNATTPESGRVTIIVYPATDLDSDGIADYLESEYGLNPNDPTDALLDNDGDGLSNVAECNLGYSPISANADFGASVGAMPASPWPAAVSSTLAVGSTPGSLSVSRSGAASYVVPIALPPGRGGVVPGISLKYSSSDGNGLLGVGWSIDGLSMITRGASNKNLYAASDAVTDEADGDASDRYYLDGMRLQVVAGAYDEADSEYRTEIETFSKIILRKNAGVQWFEIWTKAGQKMFLGSTANSRFGRSLFLLNRVEDLSGNYYEVSYSQDVAAQELPRPDAIFYTGNGSLLPQNKVRFIYKTRLAPDASVSRYIALHGVMKITRLLERIDVSHVPTSGNETVNRKYHLSYVNSAFTGRYTLSGVQEEGLSGKRLPETTFAWSTGEYGFDRVYDGMLEHPHQMLFAADFNADGKDDILRVGVHRERRTQLFLSNGSSLVPTGGAAVLNTDHHFNGGLDSISIGDMTGDGRPDIVAMFLVQNPSIERWVRRRYVISVSPEGGYTQYNVLGGEEQFRYVSGARTQSSEQLVDMDGSGRVSLFVAPSLDQVNPDCGYYKFNRSTHLFDWTSLGVAKVFSERDPYPISTASGLPGFIMAKIPVYVYRRTGGFSHTFQYEGAYTTASARFNDGVLTVANGWFASPYESNSNTGWMYGAEAYNGQPPFGLSTSSSATHKLHFSDESGTGVPSSIFLNLTSNTTYADFNGDGRDDTLYVNSTTGNPVLLITGKGIVDANVPGGPIGNERVVPMDFNGDGRTDLLIRNDLQNFRILVAKGTGVTADMLVSVTNGLGSKSEIEYGCLTDPQVYDKGAVSADPDQIVMQPAIYVVKSLNLDAGQSHEQPGFPVPAGMDTTYSISYKYEGLRSAPYRGLLGFAAMETTDSRSLITQRVEFNQESAPDRFALNGFTKKKITKRGSVKLSETDFTPSLTTLNSGLSSFVFTSSIVDKSYAIGDDLAVQGALIATKTVNQLMDSWGNITQADIDLGFGGRTIVSDSLYHVDTAAGKWLLGRPYSVISTASGTGLTDVTTTTQIYYRDTDAISENNAQGTDLLPTQIVSEPDDAAKKLVTTLKYEDGYGNCTEVSVAGRKNGLGGAENEQTRSVAYVYDTASKRFLQTSTRIVNGRSFIETTIHNQASGLIESHVDANDQSTFFYYDEFGRSKSIATASGVTVETNYQWTSDPRGKFAVEQKATFIDSQNATRYAAPPQFGIFDRLGRPVRSGAIDADGNPVWSEILYDAQGAVRAQSTAYRSTVSPADAVYWTEQGRDGIGRPGWTVLPNGLRSDLSYSDLYPQTTSTLTGTYETVATARKMRTRLDPAGRIIEAYNNEGLGAAEERDYVLYGYDAAGNLSSVNASGAITTASYDNRGLAEWLDDPNGGKRYSYHNAFGEIYKTTDAKNQETTLSYDGLGRVTQSVSPEGTTSWTYDSAVGKALGLLASVSAPDTAGGTYSATYTYDTLKPRLASFTETIAGESFSSSYGYGDASRLTGITCTAPGAKVQTLAYRYNPLGVLREIRDMHSAGVSNGLVLWALSSVNVNGQPENEIYGNGVSSWSGYSQLDGALRHRIVEGASGYLENLRLGVDPFGNIRRRDLRSGDATGTVLREESYQYDLLGRMSGVSQGANATESMTYAANGNILSKTGAGAYSYESSRPHAVTNAGGNSYQYDANGNMLGRNSVTEITWTSFDQPKSITRNARTSSFRYGPSGSRIWHDNGAGDVTRYGSGGVEFTRNASGPTARFRVFGPGGQIAEIANGADKTIRFFAGDHLGSVEAVTDQLGRALEAMSFSPWGARRNADWTPGTPTRTTNVNRGYTGHEMLDELGLVHMNGRIYDPSIARFLGVDPIVSSPLQAQTHNGYSYVANNPMSFTDPSGFQAFSLASGGYDFRGLDVYSGSRGSGSFNWSVSFTDTSWNQRGFFQPGFYFPRAMSPAGRAGFANGDVSPFRHLGNAPTGATGASSGQQYGIAPSGGAFGLPDGMLLVMDAEGGLVPRIDYWRRQAPRIVHGRKHPIDSVAVVGISASLRMLSSEQNGSAAGVAIVIDDYLDARGLGGDDGLRRLAGVGAAAGQVIETVGVARQALSPGAPPQQAQARQRVRPDNLPDHLLTKLQKITQYGANGVKQLRGAVYAEEGRAMAERFVGPGFVETLAGNTWQITSVDGLRTVRGPSIKPTDSGRNVNPVSGQPYSGTGIQMNFQTRMVPAGPWQTNVHIDVEK